MKMYKMPSFILYSVFMLQEVQKLYTFRHQHAEDHIAFEINIKRKTLASALKVKDEDEIERPA